ncbi:MAG: bifunctional folylpolyglutamate synthase/dihydrofolate synthase [Mycobacterium leprae]
MTYDEALAYLFSLQRFGIKPGLERTRELLRRVGEPERRCGRIIHITGTSGKGSVAAMTESALRAAGFRVGLYTSPSLERFTDRIQVDRRDIPEAMFAELLATVKPHVEAMVAEGLEQVTEFEVITVVALLYFAQAQLDWLVLEVGMGGRFDATNVITSPAVTCITNIGLDHTQWLGSTHEQIAYDKAGIIKPGVPCVTGTQHQGALEVIREIAVANDAPLLEVSAADYRVIGFGPEGQSVELLGARGWYSNVHLALLGRHQANNAAVALRVLELAGLNEQAIRDGFQRVIWPGRFELMQLPEGPLVVIDAAHNPAKCAALTESVSAYFPGRPVSLVLGVLADKEVSEMIRPLLALAQDVWATTPESPRQLPAAGLAELCRQAGKQVGVQPEIAAAVESAVSATRPGGVVLVTGSFYTVGPARRYLRARTRGA